MDREEKEKAITEAEAGASAPAEGTGNDLPVLLPRPEIFKLGKREYKISPLTLDRMYSLVELAEVSLTRINRETLDKIVKLVSELLPEEDCEFLRGTLTVPVLMDFFNLLQEVNYRGIPKLKGPTKGN